MRLNTLKRTYKVRILSELLNGKPGPLQAIHHNRERDPAKMTDAQLMAEIERLTKKMFQERGVVPPPNIDSCTITDEELNAIIEGK